MTTFRRVPYGPDPGAQAHPAAWWYVDNRVGVLVAEAGGRALVWMKEST